MPTIQQILADNFISTYEYKYFAFFVSYYIANLLARLYLLVLLSDRLRAIKLPAARKQLILIALSFITYIVANLPRLGRYVLVLYEPSDTVFFVWQFFFRVGCMAQVINALSFFALVRSMCMPRGKLNTMWKLAIAFGAAICCYLAWLSVAYMTVPNRLGFEHGPHVRRAIDYFWWFVLMITAYEALWLQRKQQLPRIVRVYLKDYIFASGAPALVFVVLPQLLRDSWGPLPGGDLWYWAAFSNGALFNITYLRLIWSMLNRRFFAGDRYVVGKRERRYVYPSESVFAQMKKATSLKELRKVPRIFMKRAYGIPENKVACSLRQWGEETGRAEYHENRALKEAAERFLARNISLYEGETTVESMLREERILVREEIEYINFYEPSPAREDILAFMQDINADVFVPLFYDRTIIGYIVIGRDAVPGMMFGIRERMETFFFSSYLTAHILFLRRKHYEALLKEQKDIYDTLETQARELRVLKEGMREVIDAQAGRDVGLILYKNKKFEFVNHAAREMIPVDPQKDQGHYLVHHLQKVAHMVEKYHQPHMIVTHDEQGEKMVITGLTAREGMPITILAHYPAVSDIVQLHAASLRDPSRWEYLILLQTTESGRLINAAVPGNTPQIVRFKIDLLRAVLGSRAALLRVAPEDLPSFIELMYTVSLRSVLKVYDAAEESNESRIMMDLFGMAPVLTRPEESRGFLERLTNVGMLVIKNVEKLPSSVQDRLARFMETGSFEVGGKRLVMADVRLVFTTDVDLEKLVEAGKFSAKLYAAIAPLSVELSSLKELPPHEVSAMTEHISAEIARSMTLSDLLVLTAQERTRLLEQGPTSIMGLRTLVSNALVRKGSRSDLTNLVNNPHVQRAARLGRRALTDRELLGELWQVLHSYAAIADLIGVNRSTVSRRCRDYGIGFESEMAQDEVIPPVENKGPELGA